MVEILFAFFFAFFCTFVGTYATYFAYIRRHAKKPWDLKIDYNFQPNISIIIPARNEEETIEAKLVNVQNVEYPKQKIELVVADDASEDSTIEKIKDFAANSQNLEVKIVSQSQHAGKSVALNKALRVCSFPIVVVTDADTQWPKEILQRALPYLADPKVGAVSSRGVNKNSRDSWVVKAENRYLDLISLLRLGESKIHSTIRFEGGFCAYKREAFDEFDCKTGADDSGTALEIVQRNYRTIIAPEAVFQTQFPLDLTGKVKIKTRRASQLISLWLECCRLMLRRRLVLPKRIAVPEMMLFVLNPFLLLSSIIFAIVILILWPLSYFALAVMVLAVSLVLLTRRMFFEVLVDNFILLYASLNLLLGRHYVAWDRTKC